ncbi:MAG: hypothetical protein LBU15_03850 [Rickettsiales bacterium]|jgi:phosphoserine phosphatase|nr:hypothetical protein [Rickettsiales bacterium]
MAARGVEELERGTPMSRVKTLAIVLLLSVAGLGTLGLGRFWRALPPLEPRESSGESLEERAKSVVARLDRLRTARGNADALYMFDFNNTLYIQKGLKKLGSAIATDVVMKSLFDRAEGVEDDYSEKIRDFLVARAVELGNYSIESFTNIKELYRSNENFKTDLTELVYRHFRRKIALNHRISYLLSFGCSEEQIEANYSAMTRDYCKTVEQNPLVVEIICQLLAAGRKVIIFTDSAEADVLTCSRSMGLEETIARRLGELGSRLDPETLTIAGESRMREARGVKPGAARPLIPIVGLFRRRTRISEYFFSIVAKDCQDSRESLETELREVYGLDISNSMLVMFDDSHSILKNLERQGVVPVYVDGPRATLLRREH